MTSLTIIMINIENPKTWNFIKIGLNICNTVNYSLNGGEINNTDSTNNG